MRHRNQIVVILGPTASGKSDLAIRLAQKFNGEVVSADSRQVYRGLDLGTAKVRPEEMKGIPHHLIDVASPRRIFTAYHYQKLGRLAIQKILKKGKLPIVCGGTGFYIDSLIYDYKLPPVAPQKELRKKLEKQTPDLLFSQLKRLDPERAAEIDPKNKRRLIRALEIVITTGRPVPKIKPKQIYDVLKIGINLPKEKLRSKINERLEHRLRQGMIEEVRQLHEQGLSFQRMEELGLEYRYISRYLKNLINYEELVDILKKENWHYAKRQLTWFKKDKEIRWINNYQEAEKLVDAFVRR